MLASALRPLRGASARAAATRHFSTKKMSVDETIAKAATMRPIIPSKNNLNLRELNFCYEFLEKTQL